MSSHSSELGKTCRLWCGPGGFQFAFILFLLAAPSVYFRVRVFIQHHGRREVCDVTCLLRLQGLMVKRFP